MIIEHESNPSWTVPVTPHTRPAGPVDEIEVLLWRYPLLSAAETRRCVTFLAGASEAERSVLASRPGMAAKMAQVRPDPPPFRPSLARYVVFGLLIVAMLAPLLTAAG